MCKADDTSPTSLYGPLRRIAKRNREDAETQKKCDGPEVVHVTRGDVDAIAREFNVPDVEHLTDDELLARKVRAVTNPAEVNKFLNRLGEGERLALWIRFAGWEIGRGAEGNVLQRAGGVRGARRGSHERPVGGKYTHAVAHRRAPGRRRLVRRRVSTRMALNTFGRTRGI